MNEQQLKAFTDLLIDNEKHHAEITVLKTKYVAMFAAVRSTFDKMGVEFELDETYLNELLERAAAGGDVPFATQAEIVGDEESEDVSPKVISNTGEVATFANGIEISRQRPTSWPRGFTQNRVHQALPISTVVMNYQVFQNIFAVGNTMNQVQARLMPPVVEPGTPQRLQNPGAAQDGDPKGR
jgi:hypothetical protein